MPQQRAELVRLGQYKCIEKKTTSRHARTMKISRRVRELHNQLDKVVFPDLTISGLKGEEKLEKLKYF